MPWPEPRFEIPGEEVLDRLTGLTWTRDANPLDTQVTWREALERTAEMSQGGSAHERWRVPSRLGLRSLISYQTRRPALPDGHPFVNETSTWYWSSTTARSMMNVRMLLARWCPSGTRA